MHGAYASKPKPKPVNASRLGALSPTNQQPPLVLHFFAILSPAPGGGALYHFLLEVVPFQSIQWHSGS